MAGNIKIGGQSPGGSGGGGSGTVTKVVAQGGPFLANGTITSSGTINNSVTSLTASALLLGADKSAVTALGSLGTTTTVLHGNAAGAPTFGPVSLSADVTGLLPFANLATLGATSLFGNDTGAGATGKSIPVGTGLDISTGTLVATGTVAANLVVTDGTTTVNPTAQITMVGASVADLGGGTAEITVTDGAGSVTSVIAEAGPFLANVTITSTGTITGSVATLTDHGVLVGQGASAPVATAVMTDGQLLIGTSAADPAPQTMSGDATISKAGVLALKNSGVTAAKYGDGTHVPQITVDAQGRITLAGDVAITATGDVVGPVSAVDGHLALFDGTTGKLIKDGGVPAAGSVTSVIAQGGPFLTNGTITGAGTITNSIASLTAHGVVVGEGTSAVAVTAAGTDGQLLIATTSADPAFASMSGDATITKAGVITVSKIGGVVPVTVADKGLVINSGTVQMNNTTTLTGTAAGTITIAPTTGTSDVIVNLPAAGGTVTVAAAPSFARQRAEVDFKHGATASVVTLNTGFVFGTSGGPTSYTAGTVASSIDRLMLMSPDGTKWAVLAVAQGFTL